MAKASSYPQGSRALLACIVTSLLVVLVPSVARADSSRTDRIERQIVRKVNKIRKAHGLRGLRTNRGLARAADFHCRDMLGNNFFAHSSSNGQPMTERVESFRRSHWVGETLAYVPTRGAGRQASRIVRMWMASPPHRASLLNPKFARIGVARMKGVLGGVRSIVFTADLASKR